MDNTPVPSPNSNETDVLKTFQLAELSIKEKSKPEIGKQIAQKFWSYVLSGMGGYFYSRNNRFLLNRNWSNGRVNIQAMFQDRFQMNSKQNYIRLDWQALQLIPRVISGLVGRWMDRKEKIQVRAIDNLSQSQKKEEYEYVEFIIDNKEKLELLEKESGVQLIPKNDDLPQDKEELLLWQAQFQRRPEEILYELGCNDVLSSNGWMDVLKEKMLHDSAEVGLVGTYTEMGDDGVIKVNWLKPENIVYSWSEYPDFRDSSIRGYTPSIKISELRKRYGKEFNPNNPLALSEDDLWIIAQTAQEFKNYSNITWQTYWVNSFVRPYDEWNVRALEFEIKTVDKEPYTLTKSKLTGSTYIQKGEPTTKSGKPKPRPSDNQQLMFDDNINIYQGCYLPDTDKLLKWGIKTNMIRPQDPKETGNAEFSYSFYMYQNFEMRNLALPEKVESAVKEMILSLLKIQQIIARLVPNGWAIDETKLNNIDYGTGDTKEPIHHSKVFFQTGLLYYKGVTPDGQPDPNPPIKELANSGFLGQIQGLITTYQFYYQTLKDELGEDPNLISQALQPRVTAQNVETSQATAANATDYMYRAYAECMKMTGRKISCLLGDSVKYGSDAYRHIVKKEDIELRQFNTDIEYLPTREDELKLEAIIMDALKTTPELALFVDPLQMMRIAKADVKLAEVIFRRGQKKMLLWKQETANQNQQQIIEGQIASAKSAEEEKRKTKEFEMEVEKERTKLNGQADNQSAVLNMVTTLLKPSGDKNTAGSIPAELKPLVNAVIENIMVGAIASTEEQKAQIIQQIQAARQQQETEQQQEQPMQQQPTEQQNIQPQPQMVA